MEFEIGQPVKFADTHAPYYIGEIHDTIEIDGVTHYSTDHEGHIEGYFPAKVLTAI